MTGQDAAHMFERALADHEKHDQQRHKEILDSHSQLRDEVVELRAFVRKDVEHIQRLIDDHHKSLYGDGSQDRPGVVGHVSRMLERRRVWVAIYTAGIALGGFLAALVGTYFGIK